MSQFAGWSPLLNQFYALRDNCLFAPNHEHIIYVMDYCIITFFAGNFLPVDEKWITSFDDLTRGMLYFKYQ